METGGEPSKTLDRGAQPGVAEGPAAEVRIELLGRFRVALDGREVASLLGRLRPRPRDRALPPAWHAAVDEARGWLALADGDPGGALARFRAAAEAFAAWGQPLDADRCAELARE